MSDSELRESERVALAEPKHQNVVRYLRIAARHGYLLEAKRIIAAHFMTRGRSSLVASVVADILADEATGRSPEELQTRDAESPSP